VTFRGLTNGQLRTLTSATEDPQEREALGFHLATGASLEDCRLFVQNAPMDEYLKATELLTRLSALGEDAQFRGSQADVPVDARAAE
jgi:hypothetical protein